MPDQEDTTTDCEQHIGFDDSPLVQAVNVHGIDLEVAAPVQLRLPWAPRRSRSIRISSIAGTSREGSSSIRRRWSIQELISGTFSGVGDAPPGHRPTPPTTTEIATTIVKKERRCT
jgi:hypothetical protein